MRFGLRSTKVITITIIGALKFTMWSRVVTLLRADVTGSYTIKEAAWVNERSCSLPCSSMMHTEILFHFKVPLVTDL